MNQFWTWSVGTFIVLLVSPYISGTPEYSNCGFMKANETVTRIRDTGDCHKFYYCTHALAQPYPDTCPHDNEIWLYFNPNTTECGFERDWRCYSHTPPSGGGGTGSGGGVYVPPPPPPVTTPPPPTTTTKPPRPPQLDDVNPNPLIIDCSKTPCGLYPNRYGSCNSYVMCVNGKNVTKNCNAGQQFDTKSKECKPAGEATCWTEPTSRPHIRRTQECPFHNKTASTPIRQVSGGMILQNPVVTDWGTWQGWEFCPTGKYATGMNVWRRMITQDRGKGEKTDHIGIVSVSYLCQKPGGNDTDFIESNPPNLPYQDGWPSYYMCRGGVVGFRLNSAKPRKDNIATDNVQAYCSCSEPVFKPYDEEIYEPQRWHRGDWTQPQICRKYQTVCAMQTQMQEYKEGQVGVYDNTGLNNFQVRCCDVPNPLDTCKVTEARVLVRTCDNSKVSEQGLRCDFESAVGTAFDYETNSKMVDFYTSIGYTYDEVDKSSLTKTVELVLKDQIKSGMKLEYDWDEPVASMFQDETITNRTVYVPEASKLELYQIVGRCGHFMVRTNRYAKVVSSEGGAKQTTLFEV